MELAEQWRAQGNLVERFTFSDVYPNGAGSSAKFLLRQFIFAYKAAAFIRRNAHRFDIIDALIGDLPCPKATLRFSGLLVARSVGLHRFYDEFERSIGQRWPGRPRGRWRGRLFYELVRRCRTLACEKALDYADLVNVPNAAEARCLEMQRAPDSIIVQPYGLTTDRRNALRKAAAPSHIRLRERRVCFIGMWGARKGAYDWSAIIELIRARVPEARFFFLGTMAEGERIKESLGVNCDGVDLISDYAPDELPALLANCTVGAFPSYVEGFGLAVLEQLAAGIPMVAFDVSGPRDIMLERLKEFLVPAGDLSEFARAVINILLLDVPSYCRLAERSVEAVAAYSWQGIARDTARDYRAALDKRRASSLVFVQPFGITAAGGGARILRALLQDPPVPSTIISTSPTAPDIPLAANQFHVPRRPSFGRLERSRWHVLPERVTPLFRKIFRRRLRDILIRCGATGVHAIPHSALDFYDSYLIASELGLPYFLQVHDDLLYTAKGRVPASAITSALGAAWRGAQLRFVISRQMGEEYSRRYGPREFITITDGVERVAARATEPTPARLRVYFMGLFHIVYEQNLRALVAALARVSAETPTAEISITLRCGQLNAPDLREAKNLRILPFGSEGDVERDMREADLLYLPLPFGGEFEQFVRFSLSTKLVTYVGSGIPILYHGPHNAAVCKLLEENDAALLYTSLEVDSLARLLTQLNNDPALGQQKASNAWTLARANFLLSDQRRKFWSAIGQYTHGTPAGTDHHLLNEATPLGVHAAQ